MIQSLVSFNCNLTKSSEEVTTSPVTTTEYWNAAPHPQLAHLPQLPHPLSSKVVTVQTATAKKIPTQTTKIGTYHFTRSTHISIETISMQLVSFHVVVAKMCFHFDAFLSVFSTYIIRYSNVPRVSHFAITVPIGLSRIQVVPQSVSPKIQTKLGETHIVRTVGQKNNNNKSLGTATITTTTSSPGGHIVKGKRKKVNILLEHNYA